MRFMYWMINVCLCSSDLVRIKEVIQVWIKLNSGLFQTNDKSRQH